MKMQKLRITFVVCIFLFVCINLFAEIEEFSFFRNDESEAIAYMSTPDNSESFPLVVYIDGSIMQSVKNNFNFISFLFNQHNMAVIAIEKRGITKDKVNLEEFFTHDCYENRFQDYMRLIYEISSKKANWNGQLIFIGSSEGGKIAPKLTLHFVNQTKGIILIGSGGGLSFGEEIKYQIKQIAIANVENISELDKQVDDKFAIILSNCDSLEKYYDKTFRWYAHYLKYNLLDDLLRINTPILMIHGALDTHIPVESADHVKKAFDALGKENLTYYRFEDLGHSIGKRMDIFMLLLNFVIERLIVHESESPKKCACAA